MLATMITYLDFISNFANLKLQQNVSGFRKKGLVEQKKFCVIESCMNSVWNLNFVHSSFHSMTLLVAWVDQRN